jgi:hypothetical protein
MTNKNNKKAKTEIGKTAAKPTAKVVPKNNNTAGDLKDLFAQIKTAKKSTTTAQSSSTVSSSTNAKASAAPKPVAKAGGGGGLYSAKKEQELSLSDDAFFASDDKKKKGGKKVTADADDGEKGWKEGVRVLTEDAMQGMLSKDPNAGKTENCPFDCDCCF